MSDKTGIEWTDATWNPVTGCTEVSPGCDHCYAKTFAERWRGTPGHYFENGFNVQLRPDKLEQPLRWKKPRKIFVNSMSDLFHDAVPDDYIAQVFAVMAKAQQHTFQVLTKRHARMRALLGGSRFRSQVFAHRAQPGGMYWPLKNVWLGVSAENQQWADIRIPALLETPAAVRFVSAEPLLGPIDLRPQWASWPGIDWIIVGGESGRGARPMHPAWVRSIRDQSDLFGVAFLFKQWGEWTPYAPPGVWETDMWVCQRNGVCVDEEMALRDGGDFAGMWRVGKKAAGRALDGETWDEYPVAVVNCRDCGSTNPDRIHYGHCPTIGSRD